MLDVLNIFQNIASFLQYSINTVTGIEWPVLVFRLKILSAILSVLFVLGSAYSVYRLMQILRPKPVEELADLWGGVTVAERESRWEEIKRHLESENPSDWKVAILEADGILDEIMKKVGYEGATLGERLMKIEPSDFNSLQDAWEAHKVRNKIAHEAAGYVMAREEAERVVGLFEKCLKELEYIA